MQLQNYAGRILYKLLSTEGMRSTTHHYGLFSQENGLGFPWEHAIHDSKGFSKEMAMKMDWQNLTNVKNFNMAVCMVFI